MKTNTTNMSRRGLLAATGAALVLAGVRGRPQQTAGLFSRWSVWQCRGNRAGSMHCTCVGSPGIARGQALCCSCGETTQKERAS